MKDNDKIQAPRRWNPEPMTMVIFGIGALVAFLAAMISAVRGGSKTSAPPPPPKLGPGQSPGSPTGPGTPGGGGVPLPPPPPQPPGQQPPNVGPDGLWIAPDCSDVVEGPGWLDNTARPVMQEWISDGWTDKDQWHHHYVIRSMLMPYAPLCIDSLPWLDVYVKDPNANPDEWNAILKQAIADNPKIYNLIGRMHTLYNQLSGSPIQQAPGLTFIQSYSDIPS